MFWQENINEEHFTVPDTVQDVLFQIECPKININYQSALTNELMQHFPFLKEDAIHHIYLPKSGNGWMADTQAEFLYLSKRSKLILRVKKEHINPLKKIKNLTLNIDGTNFTIIKFIKQKKMSDSSILFSHSIIKNNNLNEDDFLEQCFYDLQKLNIKPKKMLAGLSGSIIINDKKLTTQSLMVADLSKQESVLLQEQGIGNYKTYGCGIFNPQKGINEVSAV
ncbi:hypothetical protein MNB_SUP05-5-457 [hydrothermal vent metagenome]|uniref:CRISPR-associated protein, Cas6-related n=1 Tax=hydrothermal vent metagenome TaxID=652676 RepID=A0A1W1CQI1_9ZZZZ